MNYVSAQLMRARDRGVHASYLHRLYAEGLEELQKKRRQVSADALKPLSCCSNCSGFNSHVHGDTLLPVHCGP